jgi:hypothetical protein
MTRPVSRREIVSVFLAMFLAGCAIPATQVAVPTESMQDALRQARGSQRLEPANELPQRRPMRLTAPPGAPQPVLAPPDVRMAYLYEWVDAEGNKHFGGWVAIPLAGFDWVMDDGSNPSLGTPGPASAGPGSTQ